MKMGNLCYFVESQITDRVSQKADWINRVSRFLIGCKCDYHENLLALLNCTSSPSLFFACRCSPYITIFGIYYMRVSIHYKGEKNGS